MIANVLQPLIDFFELILVFFHEQAGLSWGFSIVALTLVVRIVLLPLTLKQFKSMQKMAHHAPEMRELQQKYKGDRDRLNQEMMKFYRENKVNPLASCFPMIAQIPVMLSLFYMLKSDLLYEICPDVNPMSRPNPVPCPPGGESAFLWIPNLTEPATGVVLASLIILYVGSQMLSTMLSMVSTDKTQKYIMLALPLFFVLFVWQFPAGLLVYWITTNLWTIVQQWIVRKRLGPLTPPPDPNNPTPSLFESIKEAMQPAAEPATAGGGGGGGGKSKQEAAAQPKGRATAAPPPPPRKKKKRSGRRR